jgi:NAD+ kinase
LKFGIFVHPRRPKVSAEKIASRIQSAGLICSQIEPDIAIVVGGDGTFGYYGRILAMPMLFVGVKESDDILGSKARLAETMYDCLDRALHDINAGKYRVIEKKKLSVSFGSQDTDVLTDIYLERGQFSGCIRYTVHISNRGSSFNEYAIGNGVIISTSYGSGGYFSDNRLGVCHILPTYLIRLRNGKRDLANKPQFTVPIEAQIQVKLVRNADVRLYGTTDDSRGKKILLNDTISISSSNQTAKIVKLKA